MPKPGVRLTDFQPNGQQFVLMLDFDREVYEGGPRVTVHNQRADVIVEIRQELREELASTEWRGTILAADLLALLRPSPDPDDPATWAGTLQAADAFFQHLWEFHKRPRGDFWSVYHPEFGYRSDVFPELEEAA
jgi:hypothetical protein